MPDEKNCEGPPAIRSRSRQVCIAAQGCQEEGRVSGNCQDPAFPLPGQVDRPGKFLGLAVELVLDRLGRREAKLSRCSNAHGFAGPRIAAVACRAHLHLELAKSVDRDFFAIGRSGCDRVNEAVQDLLRVGLGDALGGGNRLDQFRYSSANFPLVGSPLMPWTRQPVDREMRVLLAGASLFHDRAWLRNASIKAICSSPSASTAPLYWRSPSSSEGHRPSTLPRLGRWT